MRRLIWIIYRKEMLETLRDRRTLFVMVLLPLVLYPLVTVGLTQYAGVRQRAQALHVSTVLLRGAPWPGLGDAVREAKDVLLAKSEPSRPPGDLVHEGVVDVVIVVPGAWEVRQRSEQTVELTVHYDETRDASRRALPRVREILGKLRSGILSQRLAEKGLRPDFVQPLAFKEISVASEREVGSYLLARVLPLLVMLMVLLGAFYPAIDLTAGEKERGTLETLLIAPVPRLAVIIAKFLVVMTISVATGVLNLVSIGLTLGMGFGEALRAAKLSIEIPWSALLMTLVALVPAAAFFAAVMVAVASLGRSFKEAQNLLTPVYLVCMIPAFAAQLPGFELDAGTALIPAVNVSLLTRDLIAGHLHVIPVVLALASTAIYALITLAIAARIYDSERLLFADDRPIWRRKKKPLIEASERAVSTFGVHGVAPTLRVPGDPGAPAPLTDPSTVSISVTPARFEIDAPAPIEAGLLLLFAMALMLLVGIPLQQRSLVAGLLVTEWLLIAVPVLLALRFGGHAVVDVLSLRRPALLVLLGALLAGASGWYLVSLFVEHVQQHFLPMPKAFIEGMEKVLFGAGRPLALDLLVLAISPAICEELLFRGFILRTSRERLSPALVVLLNGVLFGLFHLSIYRFVPTAVLGVVLALIALRSGSIYPSMLFHALNNGAAILLGRALGDAAVKDAVETQGLTYWFPLATVAFVVGLVLALRRQRE
ncbi:MAG: CPBP family intramembrane metalloprotease [Deltaproteobacteria bacterium]|nr:CPBP family intramembrane metalloprotease [Deltaproteobacteria bacterium]